MKLAEEQPGYVDGCVVRAFSSAVGAIPCSEDFLLRERFKKRTIEKCLKRLTAWVYAGLEIGELHYFVETMPIEGWDFGEICRFIGDLRSRDTDFGVKARDFVFQRKILTGEEVVRLSNHGVKLVFPVKMPDNQAHIVHINTRKDGNYDVISDPDRYVIKGLGMHDEAEAWVVRRKESFPQ